MKNQAKSQSQNTSQEFKYKSQIQKILDQQINLKRPDSNNFSLRNEYDSSKILIYDCQDGQSEKGNPLYESSNIKISKEQSSQSPFDAEKAKIATPRSILSNPNNVNKPFKSFMQNKQIFNQSQDRYNNYHSFSRNDEQKSDNTVSENERHTLISKSKDKKVKFQDIYDSKNIQDVQQERQQRQSQLQDFQQRQNSRSNSQQRSVISSKKESQDISKNSSKNIHQEYSEYQDQVDIDKYFQTATLRQKSLDIEQKQNMHDQDFKEKTEKIFYKSQRINESILNQVKSQQDKKQDVIKKKYDESGVFNIYGNQKIQSSRTELVFSNSRELLAQDPIKINQNLKETFGQTKIEKVSIISNQQKDGASNKESNLKKIQDQIKQENLSSLVSDMSKQSSKNKRDYVIDHKNILARALQMHKQGESKLSIKGELDVQKQARRGIEIVRQDSPNKQLKVERKKVLSPSQKQLVVNKLTFNNKILELQEQMKQKILSKQKKMLSIIFQNFGRLLNQKVFQKLDQNREILQQKYEILLRKQQKSILLNQNLIQNIFYIWRYKYLEKLNENESEIKAQKFLKQSNKVKLKIIVFKMKKYLKKQIKLQDDLQRLLYSKNTLSNIILNWKQYVQKFQKLEKIKQFRCLRALKYVPQDENKKAQSYRIKIVSYKVLLAFKKNIRFRKKLLCEKGIAQKFNEQRLKEKSFFGLYERKMRNKQWRKDLVKRYWINNSDDSGQDDVNNNEFKLKDEFFPVQICRQKKYVNVEDPSFTFQNDVVEHIPQNLILQQRNQTQVNYYPRNNDFMTVKISDSGFIK